MLVNNMSNLSLLEIENDILEDTMTGVVHYNIEESAEEQPRIVDTTAKDSAMARKTVMVDVYSEGVGHIKSENTLRSITSVLRCAIHQKRNLLTREKDLEHLISMISEMKNIGRPSFTKKFLVWT